MQNVHWIDEDWKGTRGLGFGIYKGSNGDKWVGHGGYCPGYQSTLRLHLKSKFAYSVMINANGVSPNKYVNGMHAILNKVKADSSDEPIEKDITEYIGYYKMDVLDEIYIGTWEGDLVMMNLPTNYPGESMTLFKHIEGDTFKRIRDNDDLGEKLIFQRNNLGAIKGVLVFENYIYAKIEP